MSNSMTPEHAPIGPGNAQVMNRFELTKRLVAKLPGEEAVIGGIGNTNFDLWAAGQRPQNFYMLGSMGLACPIALGVALAQPHRRVVALEGDGSLLMQLGCLATIAMLQPANLTIVVMDNGIYQITGSQPTATRHGADIVTMARGAGIAPQFLGGGRGDVRGPRRTRARRRPVADRRPHRRAAGSGHHRARSGGDLRPLHARARRAAGAGGEANCNRCATGQRDPHNTLRPHPCNSRNANRLSLPERWRTGDRVILGL